MQTSLHLSYINIHSIKHKKAAHLDSKVVKFYQYDPIIGLFVMLLSFAEGYSLFLLRLLGLPCE